MRIQGFTDYLLKHPWQALLLTFLLTYIPVLGMGSILIAAFFTLSVGILEGAVFTLVASLPYALLFYTSQEIVPAILWATVTVSITGNLLTWAFASMLRKNCSWSLIFQMAALFGVLVISLIHLAYPNITEWWSSHLQSFYTQSSTELAAAAEIKEVQPIGEEQINTINVLKNYTTGMIMAFVLFTALVQVMIARWWQKIAVNKTRMGKELQYIHLSYTAGILFIVSLVLYYLDNRVVLDILPVLFLLFSAAGLSLIHYLCGTINQIQGRLWLAILYLILMCSLLMLALLPLFKILGIMFPVVLAILVLFTFIFVFTTLGLLDIWFDIRKRVRKV